MHVERVPLTHLATVTKRAEPSSSSNTDWILPLPKVRSPTSVARPLSCSAPARISLALALPPFSSTANGRCASTQPRETLQLRGRHAYVDGSVQAAAGRDLRHGRALVEDDALHDGQVAAVLAPLHVEDGGAAVQPQARDVQPRAHQAPRVVAQVQDEGLGAARLRTARPLISTRHMCHASSRPIQNGRRSSQASPHSGTGRTSSWVTARCMSTAACWLKLTSRM